MAALLPERRCRLALGSIPWLRSGGKLHVPDAFPYLSNTALQAALRFDLFLRMQAVIAGMFGISLAQRRNASGVQAARCSAVATCAELSAVKETSDAART